MIRKILYAGRSMDIKAQQRTPIFTALKKYKEAGITHFDVPGHKKSKYTPLAEAFGEKAVMMDANSTKELDILANPSGVIMEAETLMADAYGADYAYLLVNGSTFGVQIMIMSVCGPKDKIIMPRNVHKSAINAVILSGATPVFIQPEIDPQYGISNGVTVETVKKALKQNPDAKAVFLMNPTYFGVVSDLKEIIRIAHKSGVPVLVDQAHGAHFNFHEDLPLSGTEIGGDMTTISMHKTGGSFTQSSALLVNKGIIDINRVSATVTLMQTTSASYLLMASLDIARSQLAVYGEEIYTKLLKWCNRAKKKLNQLPGISCITAEFVNGKGVYDVDDTKFVIQVNKLGLTGFEVYDIVKKEYNLQLELGETYAVLAIVGPGDTEASISRLVEVFKDLSKRFYGKRPPFKTEIADFFDKPKQIVLPRDAYYSPKITMDINNALGQISGESIMVYPPGIPLIICGERITKKVINIYNFYREQGGRLISIEDKPGLIRVLGSEE